MAILDKQRFYQTGHGPIYMRTPASKVMVKGLYGLIIFGTIYSAYNLGKLIAGKKN
ncbi:hypothetical protein LPJ66_002894 [Kickxella alabastrina]|uniref:Uncharacterized protein n=1 Tax=Kickxella alabastrina TaxID=61397 RepID=A0ACC1IP84_9FUNG|nr:hypothetical protein LPJ66_002894 [Kickxella alabastrina]